MLLFFKTVFAVVTCLAAASCADQSGGLGLGRPNAIIVREFALNQAAVTLDPSFGFSLYRGTPGVPPRQRAASVGRAAAFNVSDAIVEQLRQAGYDAIRSDGTSAEPFFTTVTFDAGWRRLFIWLCTAKTLPCNCHACEQNF